MAHSFIFSNRVLAISLSSGSLSSRALPRLVHTPIVGRCEYNSSVWFLRSFPSRLSPPPLREPSLKQPHSTLYRRRASLCCYRSGREFSIPQLPIHHLPALVSDGLANDPRLLGRAPVSVPCSILDPRCFSSVIAFLPLVKRTAAFVKPSTS